MIQTGNLEVDAAIVELQTQIMLLVESNAAKAGVIAGLKAQLAEKQQVVSAKS